LENFGALHRLKDFACEFGRKFYGIDTPRTSVKLVRKPFVVPLELPYADETIVPYKAGQTLNWSLEPL
jgi:dihydroorotase